ncbi:dephospho-CoA kinase [Rhizobium sp. Root73]|uniref:dephospho-CoA kinase n=1 Tax=unclassified Rhizobium TaxID=2613769 RepID=UPI000715F89E|nr:MULTISPECIES: dephospho-CoA kinase [unclassified Rhizobium]KQV39491.1 dephospho-CoA kinase [Rhizobium sp. Root1204]KQY02176.1 dephospho-CoA kinase [Rhizobium sp. Root1334]KRB96074.1 dephospho-CoA kinase [Rhizobium sp. Root73]
MIILGLTGSIGMGKSTTAAMFAEMGVPVNDADAVVHALYQGEAVAPIEAAFPGTAKAGSVDRTELSRQLAADPSLFKTLEAIVHPLVREKERAFLDHHRAAGAPLVLLDIPLLYETNGQSRVDAVAVVTCDPEIQRERVLKRPGMTAEKFALILSRQVPDQEKRAKADYIIDTGHGLDSARDQVAAIVQRLTSQKRP